MIHYIGKRLAWGLVSLIGLLALVFFLTRLTGDPAALFLPPDASPEARAEFARFNGLDRPVIVQFGQYAVDALQLDFGQSLRQNRPAMEVALEAFPVTLMLAAVAISLSVMLAVMFGALAAARPGGWADRVVSLLSLIGASAPDFWIAIVGVLFFSVWLNLLPTSGTGGIAYWIMPVAVLMLRPTGLLVQVVRGTMVGVLSSPYIKTARAKGAPPRRILFRHALKNSALPIITVIGDLTAGMINGAVVVEAIFGWPGIGALMIEAISQRDFAVVQSTILVTAMAIFTLNLIIDLVYFAIDPRIAR